MTLTLSSSATHATYIRWSSSAVQALPSLHVPPCLGACMRPAASPTAPLSLKRLSWTTAGLSLEEIQDLFEARSSGSKPPAAAGRCTPRDGGHDEAEALAGSGPGSRAEESSMEHGRDSVHEPAPQTV